MAEVKLNSRVTRQVQMARVSTSMELELLVCLPLGLTHSRTDVGQILRRCSVVPNETKYS